MKDLKGYFPYRKHSLRAPRYCVSLLLSLQTRISSQGSFIAPAWPTGVGIRGLESNTCFPLLGEMTPPTSPFPSLCSGSSDVQDVRRHRGDVPRETHQTVNRVVIRTVTAVAVGLLPLGRGYPLRPLCVKSTIHFPLERQQFKTRVPRDRKCGSFPSENSCELGQFCLSVPPPASLSREVLRHLTCPGGPLHDIIPTRTRPPGRTLTISAPSLLNAAPCTPPPGSSGQHS